MGGGGGWWRGPHHVVAAVRGGPGTNVRPDLIEFLHDLSCVLAVCAGQLLGLSTTH